MCVRVFVCMRICVCVHMFTCLYVSSCIYTKFPPGASEQASCTTCRGVQNVVPGSTKLLGVGRPKRRSRANLASVGRPKRRSSANLASAGRSKRRSSANLASAGHRTRRSKAIETSIHPKQYKTSACSAKSMGIETFDATERIQNFCKCIATAFPSNVATTESFQNFCKCSDFAFPT